MARLGAQVHAINIEPNGRNINLNCGSLHLESLQVRVGEVKADLGVAFDGDADRALFVDAKGKIVDGDATLWILGNYLKSRGELSGNKIVATGMSNIGLELAREIEHGSCRLGAIAAPLHFAAPSAAPSRPLYPRPHSFLC